MFSRRFGIRVRTRTRQVLFKATSLQISQTKERKIGAEAADPALCFSICLSQPKRSERLCCTLRGRQNSLRRATRMLLCNLRVVLALLGRSTCYYSSGALRNGGLIRNMERLCKPLRNLLTIKISLPLTFQP